MADLAKHIRGRSGNGPMCGIPGAGGIPWHDRRASDCPECRRAAGLPPRVGGVRPAADVLADVLAAGLGNWGSVRIVEHWDREDRRDRVRQDVARSMHGGPTVPGAAEKALGWAVARLVAKCHTEGAVTMETFDPGPDGPEGDTDMAASAKVRRDSKRAGLVPPAGAPVAAPVPPPAAIPAPVAPVGSSGRARKGKRGARAEAAPAEAAPAEAAPAEAAPVPPPAAIPAPVAPGGPSVPAVPFRVPSFDPGAGSVLF